MWAATPITTGFDWSPSTESLRSQPGKAHRSPLRKASSNLVGYVALTKHLYLACVALAVEECRILYSQLSRQMLWHQHHRAGCRDALFQQQLEILNATSLGHVLSLTSRSRRKVCIINEQYPIHFPVHNRYISSLLVHKVSGYRIKPFRHDGRNQARNSNRSFLSRD